MSDLRNALNDVNPPRQGKAATITPPAKAARQPGKKQQESRQNKVNITYWCDVEVRNQLKILSIETGITMQELVSQALDDLFQSYNKPRIAGSRGEEE